VKPDTKALRRLKRKYSKNPEDRGVDLVKKLLLSYSPGWVVVWVLRKYFVKSDYKASRESIKFFQLSNRAYGAGKARKAQRLLTIALRLLGDGLPSSYISKLHLAIATTLRDETKRSSTSDTILSATREIAAGIFDASHWYQLSRGLFSLGYFRAAWVARENSLDLSISESLASGSSATALLRGIEANLERRNFSDAEMDISRSTSKISAELLSNFQGFLAMVKGKSFIESHSENDIKYFSESIFREQIEGKDVVLVGTGDSHGEFGREIDAAETVVRIKYVGVENLPEPKFLGKNCSIAVHGSLKSLNEFFTYGGKVNFAGINLFLTQEKMSTDFFEKWNIAPQSKFNHAYRSTLISGVLTLYTLLEKLPRSLKLYGFDFRCSRIQYNAESANFYKHRGVILGDPYPGFDTQLVPEVVIAEDFAQHDFVSNFCFAQNLYNAGLFEIEPYGKSILELTPYQYVERLEEMLGDW